MGDAGTISSRRCSPFNSGSPLSSMDWPWACDNLPHASLSLSSLPRKDKGAVRRSNLNSRGGACDGMSISFTEAGDGFCDYVVGGRTLSLSSSIRPPTQGESSATSSASLAAQSSLCRPEQSSAATTTSTAGRASSRSRRRSQQRRQELLASSSASSSLRQLFVSESSDSDENSKSATTFGTGSTLSGRRPSFREFRQRRQQKSRDHRCASNSASDKETDPSRILGFSSVGSLAVVKAHQPQPNHQQVPSFEPRNFGSSDFDSSSFARSFPGFGRSDSDFDDATQASSWLTTTAMSHSVALLLPCGQTNASEKTTQSVSGDQADITCAKVATADQTSKNNASSVHWEIHKIPAALSASLNSNAERYKSAVNNAHGTREGRSLLHKSKAELKSVYHRSRSLNKAEQRRSALNTGPDNVLSLDDNVVLSSSDQECYPPVSWPHCNAMINDNGQCQAQTDSAESSKLQSSNSNGNRCQLFDQDIIGGNHAAHSTSPGEMSILNNARVFDQLVQEQHRQQQTSNGTAHRTSSCGGQASADKSDSSGNKPASFSLPAARKVALTSEMFTSIGKNGCTTPLMQPRPSAVAGTSPELSRRLHSSTTGGAHSKAEIVCEESFPSVRQQRNGLAVSAFKPGKSVASTSSSQSSPLDHVPMKESNSPVIYKPLTLSKDSVFKPIDLPCSEFDVAPCSSLSQLPTDVKVALAPVARSSAVGTMNANHRNGKTSARGLGGNATRHEDPIYVSAETVRTHIAKRNFARRSSISVSTDDALPASRCFDANEGLHSFAVANNFGAASRGQLSGSQYSTTSSRGASNGDFANGNLVDRDAPSIAKIQRNTQDSTKRCSKASATFSSMKQQKSLDASFSSLLSDSFVPTDCHLPSASGTSSYVSSLANVRQSLQKPQTESAPKNRADSNLTRWRERKAVRSSLGSRESSRSLDRLTATERCTGSIAPSRDSTQSSSIALGVTASSTAAEASPVLRRQMFRERMLLDQQLQKEDRPARVGQDCVTSSEERQGLPTSVLRFSIDSDIAPDVLDCQKVLQTVEDFTQNNAKASCEITKTGNNRTNGLETNENADGPFVSVEKEATDERVLMSQAEDKVTALDDNVVSIAVVDTSAYNNSSLATTNQTTKTDSANNAADNIYGVSCSAVNSNDDGHTYVCENAVTEAQTAHSNASNISHILVGSESLSEPNAASAFSECRESVGGINDQNELLAVHFDTADDIGSLSEAEMMLAAAVSGLASPAESKAGKSAVARSSFSSAADSNRKANNGTNATTAKTSPRWSSAGRSIASKCSSLAASALASVSTVPKLWGIPGKIQMPASFRDQPKNAVLANLTDSEQTSSHKTIAACSARTTENAASVVAAAALATSRSSEVDVDRSSLVKAAADTRSVNAQQMGLSAGKLDLNVRSRIHASQAASSVVADLSTVTRPADNSKVKIKSYRSVESPDENLDPAAAMKPSNQLPERSKELAEAKRQEDIVFPANVSQKAKLFENLAQQQSTKPISPKRPEFRQKVRRWNTFHSNNNQNSERAKSVERFEEFLESSACSSSNGAVQPKQALVVSKDNNFSLLDTSALDAVIQETIEARRCVEPISGYLEHIKNSSNALNNMSFTGANKPNGFDVSDCIMEVSATECSGARTYSLSSRKSEQEAADDFDLSKLSLAEKTRLFETKRNLDSAVRSPSKATTHFANRRQTSRYQTQPISLDEFHMAAANNVCVKNAVTRPFAINQKTPPQNSSADHSYTLPLCHQKSQEQLPCSSSVRCAKSVSPSLEFSLAAFKPIAPEIGDQQVIYDTPLIKVQPKAVRSSASLLQEQVQSSRSHSKYTPGRIVYLHTEENSQGRESSTDSNLSPKAGLQQSQVERSNNAISGIEATAPSASYTRSSVNERELSTIERRKAAREKRRQLTNSNVPVSQVVQSASSLCTKGTKGEDVKCCIGAEGSSASAVELTSAVAANDDSSELVTLPAQAQRFSVSLSATKSNYSICNSTTVASSDDCDEALQNHGDLNTDAASRLNATRTASFLRSQTQPISRAEVNEAMLLSQNNAAVGNSGTSSIHNRINALKQVGEQEWRKRISEQQMPKHTDAQVLAEKKNADYLSAKNNSNNIGMENGLEVSQLRPKSIADRLERLLEAQDTWHNRVEAKDSDALTVAGKMSKAAAETRQASSNKAVFAPLVIADSNDSSADSKLVTGKGRTPAPREFKSQSEASSRASITAMLNSSLAAKLPTMADHPTLTKSLTAPAEQKKNAALECNGHTSLAATNSRLVFDEGFAAFYASGSVNPGVGTNASLSSHFAIDDDVLDQIASLIPSKKLSITKSVKPPKRKTAASTNPLKSLALRCSSSSLSAGDNINNNSYNHCNGRSVSAQSDASLSDAQVSSRVASSSTPAARGLKQLQQPSQLNGKTSHLAVEALAALAAKEDFSAITLKKCDSGATVTGREDLPYNNTMLIQVKGRKHVQCRLVPPHLSSLNNGDCFILVTQDCLFLYLAKFSSLLEKAKVLAQEMATFVLNEKDLGCKANAIVVIDDDPVYIFLHSHSLFWQILKGGYGEIKNCTDLNEDELYENISVATNMIYRPNAEGDCLVPVEEYWGQFLRPSMLDSKLCYVCDFGSELYVWMGKKADFSSRRSALKLARELWHSGYDFSQCDFNPLAPMQAKPSSGDTWKHESRPQWAIFGKISERMETVLFKGKFVGWSKNAGQTTRQQGGLERSSESCDNQTVASLRSFSASAMLERMREEPNLILENVGLGRGTEVLPNVADGLCWMQQTVVTQCVQVWHVLEFGHSPLPPESVGQFHSGDTYVVRWAYQICSAGTKLDGTASRFSQAGRDRVAYFFWQGKDSAVTAQGAAALMTVDLDEERGPHIRVNDGIEPPCFLHLFDGYMTIYSGKREQLNVNIASCRLFILLGQVAGEASLREVPLAEESLREQGSFVLVNAVSNRIVCWHGAYSPTHIRSMARQCAVRLKQKQPKEMNFATTAEVSVSECFEGQESTEFLAAFGLSTTQGANTRHGPLAFPRLPVELQSPSLSTIRLFSFSSVLGEFQAVDVASPSYCASVYAPFPYLPMHLYEDVTQPALFLVDAGSVMFLWIGGFELSADLNEGSHQKLSFQQNLSCTLDTVVEYQKLKSATMAHDEAIIPVYVVWATVEPEHFIALFPSWNPTSYKKCFILPDLAENRCSDDRLETLGDLLRRLRNTVCYPLEQLRTRPLPPGVDSSRLEVYLTDEDFAELFKSSKREFEALPIWKQLKLKQDAQLF